MPVFIRVSRKSCCVHSEIPLREAITNSNFAIHNVPDTTIGVCNSCIGLRLNSKGSSFARNNASLLHLTILDVHKGFSALGRRRDIFGVIYYKRKWSVFFSLSTRLDVNCFPASNSLCFILFRRSVYVNDSSHTCGVW